jgi:ankyrin repeat protein
VWLLLGHEADVHVLEQYGLTPYQIANLRGHAEVGRLLVEHGADKTRLRLRERDGKQRITVFLCVVPVMC